ncbi:MAG: hypothetical protein OEU26_27410 [Candidatus Tectomicrobia bacterium]|nr:hypothetical protein [Candidatus Tectomicrobia bacterium]
MANVVFFRIEEPGGHVEHIAKHGLTPEDVEYADATAEEFTVSRSSGRPAFSGLALDGRDIFVVYEEIDATTWYVVTAYAVERGV